MRLTKRKKKILLWTFAVIALFAAVRVALPPIIKVELNKRLASLDGPLCAHIEDFDIAILSGGYRLNGLTVSRWNEAHAECFGEVLRVESVAISLSWSQLLRGRARLDVDARAPVVIADNLVDALNSHKKGNVDRDAAKAAKATADTLVPWRIDSLEISQGSINYKLLGTNDSAMTLHDAEGIITGIEQGRQEARPILYRLKGNMLRNARLLLAGSLDLSAEPTLWKLDYSVENADLTQANPLLLNRLPLSFTSGQLDVFGEAAGDSAHLTGYAKTIFRDIDVVTSKEHWINFKHGLVEIVSSLFFIVAKNHKRETAATIINFGTNSGGKFSVDIAGAVSRALEHRAGTHIIRPGMENRLALPKRNETDPTSQARAGNSDL